MRIAKVKKENDGAPWIQGRFAANMFHTPTSFAGVGGLQLEFPIKPPHGAGRENSYGDSILDYPDGKYKQFLTVIEAAPRDVMTLPCRNSPNFVVLDKTTFSLPCPFVKFSSAYEFALVQDNKYIALPFVKVLQNDMLVYDAALTATVLPGTAVMMKINPNDAYPVALHVRPGMARTGAKWAPYSKELIKNWPPTKLYWMVKCQERVRAQQWHRDRGRMITNIDDKNAARIGYVDQSHNTAGNITCFIDKQITMREYEGFIEGGSPIRIFSSVPLSSYIQYVFAGERKNSVFIVEHICAMYPLPWSSAFIETRFKVKLSNMENPWEERMPVPATMPLYLKREFVTMEKDLATLATTTELQSDDALDHTNTAMHMTWNVYGCDPVVFDPSFVPYLVSNDKTHVRKCRDMVMQCAHACNFNACHEVAEMSWMCTLHKTQSASFKEVLSKSKTQFKNVPCNERNRFLSTIKSTGVQVVNVMGHGNLPPDNRPEVLFLLGCERASLAHITRILKFCYINDNTSVVFVFDMDGTPTVYDVFINLVCGRIPFLFHYPHTSEVLLDNSSSAFMEEQMVSRVPTKQDGLPIAYDNGTALLMTWKACNYDAIVFDPLFNPHLVSMDAAQVQSWVGALRLCAVTGNLNPCDGVHGLSWLVDKYRTQSDALNRLHHSALLTTIPSTGVDMSDVVREALAQLCDNKQSHNAVHVPHIARDDFLKALKSLVDPNHVVSEISLSNPTPTLPRHSNVLVLFGCEHDHLEHVTNVLEQLDTETHVVFVFDRTVISARDWFYSLVRGRIPLWFYCPPNKPSCRAQFPPMQPLPQKWPTTAKTRPIYFTPSTTSVESIVKLIPYTYSFLFIVQSGNVSSINTQADSAFNAKTKSGGKGLNVRDPRLMVIEDKTLQLQVGSVFVVKSRYDADEVRERRGAVKSGKSYMMVFAKEDGSEHSVCVSDESTSRSFRVCTIDDLMNVATTYTPDVIVAMTQARPNELRFLYSRCKNALVVICDNTDILKNAFDSTYEVDLDIQLPLNPMPGKWDEQAAPNVLHSFDLQEPHGLKYDSLSDCSDNYESSDDEANVDT